MDTISEEPTTDDVLDADVEDIVDEQNFLILLKLNSAGCQKKSVTKSQNVIDIRLKYSKFDHNIGFVLGSQCGLYQSVARTFAPQSWQALQLRSASRFM